MHPGCFLYRIEPMRVQKRRTGIIMNYLDEGGATSTGFFKSRSAAQPDDIKRLKASPAETAKSQTNLV